MCITALCKKYVELIFVFLKNFPKFLYRGRESDGGIRVTTTDGSEKKNLFKIYLMLNHQFIYINKLKRQLGIRIFVIKVIFSKKKTRVTSHNSGWVFLVFWGGGVVK